MLTGGALAKTFGCYSYQSCEHAGWDGSESAQLVKLIKASVDGAEYDDDTPWGWD